MVPIGTIFVRAGTGSPFVEDFRRHFQILPPPVRDIAYKRIVMAYDVDELDRSYEDRERIVTLLRDITVLEMMSFQVYRNCIIVATIMGLLQLPNAIASVAWVNRTLAWHVVLLTALDVLMLGLIATAIWVIMTRAVPFFMRVRPDFEQVARRTVKRYIQRDQLLYSDLETLAAIDAELIGQIGPQLIGALEPHGAAPEPRDS